MRLRDLTAQDQADTTSSRLCRIERSEDVRWIQEPRTFIFYFECDLLWICLPANAYAILVSGGSRLAKYIGARDTPGFKHGIDSIADQINQHLLQLIGIGAEGD